MGELIDLAQRRADRSRVRGTGVPSFFFNLACPFSYLAAERVERVLGDVEWVPVALDAASHPNRSQLAATRAHAESCAVALRLPLVWPETFPGSTPRALRAACFAAERGAGARFALAAGRLAFCGGFDLQDPEILAEAAAASGIGLTECMAAAGETERDEALKATGIGLASRGVSSLPAIRVAKSLFAGDGALASATAMLRSYEAQGRPLVG